MRAFLEQSRTARTLAVVVAAAAVMALVHAAAAGDDLGIRRAEFWPEPPAAVAEIPAVAAPPPRHARRIWAASPSRPLQITLDRRRPPSRMTAHASGARPTRLARLRPTAMPQVEASRLIVLPKPARPALVSIYQDSTLRNGDAVMMADGIHILKGAGIWPYRPKDFVRLPLVAALDWHLRQTLNVLDRNPPMRWSSNETTSG